MSILDRKPKKYSTSDLIWAPHQAPTDGAVGDINPMLVDPSHLSMAQDVIVSKDGTLRSRGGLVHAATAPGFYPLTMLQLKAQTMAVTYDFTGAVFNTSLRYNLNNTLASWTRVTLIGESGSISDNKLLDTATADYHWEFLKLHDKDAAIITGATPYGVNADIQQSTLIWGGSPLNSDVTGGTFTSTIGSTAVVGVGTLWGGAAMVDTYLLDNTTGLLIGQVKSVGSTTTLTLYEPAYASRAGIQPTFKTARMLRLNVYKGRITTATGSTSVVGSGTKFITSGPSKQSTAAYLVGWYIFRLSDGAYVGTVSSIQNETTLTLAGNAAIAMSNEEYIMRAPIPGTSMLQFIPQNYITAQTSEYYADRYWYGGLYLNDYLLSSVTTPKSSTFTGNVKAQNSLTFTRKNQPELFDVSAETGDIITIPSVGNLGEDIRCLKATKGGMLILRGKDTYFLTGYSPETFRTIKIVDDGCLGAHYVKRYNEGVIWCGLKSVWYFDGTRVVDLLQNKVKDFYAKNVTAASGALMLGGMAVVYDHAIFSWKITSPVTVAWPYKNTSDTLALATFTINMTNGAVSFFTNLYVHNHTDYTLSGTTTATPIILASDGNGALNNGYFIDGTKLFSDTSTAANNVDAATLAPTFATNNAILGPNVMFETVKYALGDGSRLKFFKMFLMNYLSDNAMTVSVSGTTSGAQWPNTTAGTVIGTTMPTNASVLLKRLKFLIRAPSLSIRVYNNTPASAGVSQRFKMYWYTIGGKFMRIGRQQ